MIARHAPGSDEARAQGCTCTVIDAESERYRLRNDCPLHGDFTLTLTEPGAGLSHDD